MKYYQVDLDNFLID